MLADTVGWRNGFLVLAAVLFACGLAVAAILPREKNFVRQEGVAASARQMLGHLRNPRLLAIYAVGFGTLFNFILGTALYGLTYLYPVYLAQIRGYGLGELSFQAPSWPRHTRPARHR